MRRYLFLIPLLLASQAWGIKNLSGGIAVDFNYSGSTPFGSNMVWTTLLINQTNVIRTCRVTMDADVLQYNGEHIGDLVTRFTTNTINPGCTAIVEVVVHPGTYTRWTGITMTFELNSALYVKETGDRWIGTGRTVLNPSANVITTIVPTPPIPLGQSLTATVRYLNPLAGPLHNVKGSMSAGEELNGTNNSFTKSSWDIGTVETNAWITLSTNYVAGQAGRHNISFFITARELGAVKGYIPVAVIAPEAVLPAQVILKPEALEVSPGILTAFVRLPEGYPVSGITSATCDGAPAERMMPNDDGAEMIIKFRRQDIEKTLAQIGQVLDTTFVVRGTWQGPTGTRLFQGIASIKKIVESKDEDKDKGKGKDKGK